MITKMALCLSLGTTYPTCYWHGAICCIYLWLL